MLVELIKINKIAPRDWTVEKVYINPRYIISLSEEREYKRFLIEGKMNIDINRHAEFTKIKCLESAHIKEIVVIGSPTEIQSKLHKKQILRG